MGDTYERAIDVIAEAYGFEPARVREHKPRGRYYQIMR